MTRSMAYFSLFSFFMLFAHSGIALAQPAAQGGSRMMRQQQDPSGKLNRALRSAGAPALSEAQQQQITTLVANYRAAHQKGAQGAPDEELISARKQLEAAILARDAAAVNAAATAVSNRIAERAAAMIRDMGILQIQLLEVLSREQVDALRTEYGNSGLVHTLGSLAGHRGFHRGMWRGWK